MKFSVQLDLKVTWTPKVTLKCHLSVGNNFFEKKNFFFFGLFGSPFFGRVILFSHFSM